MWWKDTATLLSGKIITANGTVCLSTPPATDTEKTCPLTFTFALLCAFALMQFTKANATNKLKINSFFIGICLK